MGRRRSQSEPTLEALGKHSSHIPFLEEADRFNTVLGEFAASLS
jgi:hypothetical protein